MRGRVRFRVGAGTDCPPARGHLRATLLRLDRVERVRERARGWRERERVKVRVGVRERVRVRVRIRV